MSLETPRRFPNILDVIGRTPLVKLNKIPEEEGLQCELWAKCEFLNPGGSVKDRIGYRMVQDAEAQGLLKPGCTIIEPTSGNTGIGLAMACAVRGYKCVIVMPDKMSNEKVLTLRALGAEIIQTPIEAAFDHPDSHISVAKRLNSEIENSFILDQYKNPGNPLAHYDNTATEILWQCENDVDMIVVGAGTGGTVSGIGKKVKEQKPECVIVGVDPHYSILAPPESQIQTDDGFYEVEGIGYDFVPNVLDYSVVDKWIKVGDKESFEMARRLQKEEGLLVGGSCGSAVYAACKMAKDLKKGQKCVVILPDGIRNYLTKFVQDNWLEARGLKDTVNQHNHWWWNCNISKLNLQEPHIITPETTCQEAINILKEKQIENLPVVDEKGTIRGAVTLESLTTQIVSKNLKQADTVAKAIYKKAIKLDVDTPLGKIARVLEVEPCVILYDETDDKKAVKGVVTKADFLRFVSENINTCEMNGKH